MRVAIPTKDRSGNLALCLSSITTWLDDSDEIWLYDDGHRPAMADYGSRAALDIARSKGAEVVIKRGLPNGIAAARAEILEDAAKGSSEHLMMVDDDILVDRACSSRLLAALDEDADYAQYSVPVIALPNNEAGVSGFTNTTSDNAAHQQFILDGSGIVPVTSGAWTCAILFNLDRMDVDAAISRLRKGPKVVEDYTLTVPLKGVVVQRALVWHIMTHEQGDRGWETLALDELRRQVGASHHEA